jgi:hypothetical protein
LIVSGRTLGLADPSGGTFNAAGDFARLAPLAISVDSRAPEDDGQTILWNAPGWRFNGLAMGGNAATRDDMTDGRALAGVRIPDLDLYVVTFGDNIVSLSVVTGEAAEGDLGAGPGRDVAGD